MPFGLSLRNEANVLRSKYFSDGLIMPSWYYEKSDLAKTPSIRNGLSLLQERTFRKEGASYIMELGNYLQLHYVTCATACTFFHRFYMFHSFSEYPRYLTATACLFLAGKVEETPKKWKVVWKAATEILKQDQLVGFEGFDHKLLTYERILLQAIQFDLIVEHPHQYITKYAKTLKGSKEKVEKLVQIAWNFANDSLRTTLCLEWEPPIIAIAFLQLAGKFNNVDLNAMQGVSDRKNWWYLIFDDLSEDLLEDICHQVLDLYNDSKSGSKLKQDVKKKRHSSKISASSGSQTASGAKTSSHNGSDSKSHDDGSRKKSRHSKHSSSSTISSQASSTPNVKQVPSQLLAPKTEALTSSSQTGTPNVVPTQQPTVYFAATPATSSQSGGQTVIVYCQPGGTTGYQLPTGVNSVFTMPKMPTNDSSKPESANNFGANGGNQVLNGYPNMFYQMPSNVQMTQQTQPQQSNMQSSQISSNSPGYVQSSNSMNSNSQHAFVHQNAGTFNQGASPNPMMMAMNHFNLQHSLFSHQSQTPQQPQHQMTNSPYTVPVPNKQQNHNGSVTPSANSGSPNPAPPPFSRSNHMFQNHSSSVGPGDKLGTNSYHHHSNHPPHSSESGGGGGGGGRYLNNNNNNNYHHSSSNHSRDSIGSHHSGAHGGSRSGSKHSADHHHNHHNNHHHSNWGSKAGTASAHSARWNK